MEVSIGIYQPFYKPALVERLDSGFIALNWLPNPAPAQRELALHHYIAVRKIYSKHRLTGVFSPKFFAKTNLSSQQVYDWIQDNPGHDIYLISGEPHLTYANYNAIERISIIQSSAFETRLRSLCGEIGFNLPDFSLRQTAANSCYCNYWIASATFWENWFKDVVAPIAEMIRRHKETDSFLAYGIHAAPTPVYQLTFIYELLINHYILQKRVNSIYYPWNAQNILSLDYHPSIRAYLEDMMPLVDRIDARGQWNDKEKSWLRQRYAATRLVFAARERLSFDLADFDLPSRYPGMGPSPGTGNAFLS
jgi:hypothetical protein